LFKLRDCGRTRRLAAADHCEGRALARRTMAIRNFEAAGGVSDGMKQSQC